MDFDQLSALLASDRSVRRFREDLAIDESVLRRLIGLTRYCASGRNAQPLRYRLVTHPADRDLLFPLLKWAGYYTDWDGPAPGERPAAYLIQCLDTAFGANCLCDDGLQLQAISLGATALGLGGCIIKAFNAEETARVLQIPSNLTPRYVYALGVPAERTRIVDIVDGDFKYFRDADDTQCVPKRPLEDLII